MQGNTAYHAPLPSASSNPTAAPSRSSSSEAGWKRPARRGTALAAQHTEEGAGWHTPEWLQHSRFFPAMCGHGSRRRGCWRHTTYTRMLQRRETHSCANLVAPAHCQLKTSQDPHYGSSEPRQELNAHALLTPLTNNQSTRHADRAAPHEATLPTAVCGAIRQAKPDQTSGSTDKQTRQPAGKANFA